MTASPEYYLIRLNLPPRSVLAAQERRENYRRQYTAGEDAAHRCAIRFLCEGQVRIDLPGGSVTWEKGSLRTTVTGASGEETGLTPVVQELFVELSLAEPPLPLSEEDVAGWRNINHEVILPVHVASPAVCRRVAELLKSMTVLMESRSVTRELRLHTCLYECLAILTEHAVLTAQSNQQNLWRDVSHYTQKACCFLESNLAQRPTVLQVAEHVGISYDYLKRVFRKDMNITLKEYANLIRIRRVAQMITVEDMTLQAAGLAVGVENLKYLSRLFFRYAGVSATEYRGIYRQRQKQDPTAAPELPAIHF